MFLVNLTCNKPSCFFCTKLMVRLFKLVFTKVKSISRGFGNKPFLPLLKNNIIFGMGRRAKNSKGNSSNLKTPKNYQKLFLILNKYFYMDFLNNVLSLSNLIKNYNII